MRALQAPLFVVAVVLVVAPAGCGLDAAGLLVVDAGSDGLVAADNDANAVDPTSDADPTGEPQAGDDAETASSRDAGPEPGRDASTTAKPDASPIAPKDAGADASVFTCSSCAQAMCPTQLAACPAGSQCLAYRDCSVACSINGSSNCSSTCGSMYPSGQTAFAALTICDLKCGAGCAATLATGTP